MVKQLRAYATLPALDLDRARRWYAEKLDLTPIREQPQGCFFETGEGSNFFLYPTGNPARGGHTQLGFASTDIEADVRELKERGVVFEEYDMPGLKTENSIASNSGVRAAWFKDSEGNTLGLAQVE